MDVCHRETQIDGQEDARHVPGGGVEAIEGGAPAAGEAGLASLALELLDAVAATITDEGMESGIGVTPIVAERIGTGTSRRADVLMFAPPAFAFGPGKDAGLVSVPPERLGMGMAADGAIQRRAGLQRARFFRE